MFEKSKSCQFKKQFKTYKEAERNIHGLRRHQGEKGLHIYSCNYCQFFHVGHEVVKRKGKHVR